MACTKPPWVQQVSTRQVMQYLRRSGVLCIPNRTISTLASGVLHDSHDTEHEDAVAVDLPMRSNSLQLKAQGDIALIALMKLCAKQKDLYQSSRLHADILKRGLLEKNRFVGNTLVNVYAKCGTLAKAQQVFDNLPARDVVSWTALVVGYTENGYGKEAIKCFQQMHQEGLSPDAVIFSCILKACGSIGAAAKGKEIHVGIITTGFLGNNTVLGNALVDMYAKCGALSRAHQVLEELPVRNVISWTTLITGYCQHGYGEEALDCFERMKHEGLSPNPMTFACILKACGTTGAADKGEAIHVEILRKGFFEKDIVLGNAVVDMYAKCGDLAKAHEVFMDLRVRDIFSWNALVAGYVNHGQAEEALDCFERMKHENLSPDSVTFVCMLKACSSIGAAEKGTEIHAEIIRNRLLGKSIVLGNALVDMYAKCGALAKALQVFNELPARDVVSWTALISGLCEHGHSEEALSCFERMKREEGLSPNAITFACILKACSTVGAAEKGQTYFESMSTRYGIIPTSEHHACLVALWGHVGYLEKAMATIKKMPSSDHLSAWSALLGASCKWGNKKLGKVAFQHCVRLDEKSSLAYVRMSNIFADVGVQEGVDIIGAVCMEDDA